MYDCITCGKGFSTSQALASHRHYAHALVPSGKTIRPSDSQSLRLSDSQLATKSQSLRLSPRVSDSQSRVLAEAESAALKTWKTGRISKSRASSGALANVQWGKAFASVAIGIFVVWLVYKSLESWEWKGAGKKQVSPYKLIGGLITGLG
jgi:hypothetical protein